MKEKNNVTMAEMAIVRSLKKNIRFYPYPGTQQFKALSKGSQKAALSYFKGKSKRIERLRRRYFGESKFQYPYPDPGTVAFDGLSPEHQKTAQWLYKTRMGFMKRLREQRKESKT